MPLLDVAATPLQTNKLGLTIDSTLNDLFLHQHNVDIHQVGAVLFEVFEAHATLPGVILWEGDRLVGMLSRRRFFEIFSRRYGPELFLKRPIRLLYEYAQQPFITLAGTMTVVEAMQPALDRDPLLLFEPILVECRDRQFALLDVQHLLLAHTRIHDLTTELLRQQTHAKLLQTEKMASLGIMVAGVAHELLNPVNFVCGNLDYLSDYIAGLIDLLTLYEQEYPEDAPAIATRKSDLEFEFILQDLPRIVDSMRIGSERLERIISALRNFSHMDEQVKRPLDLHQCLDNTLLILNSRIKNFITVEKKYGQIPQINCFSGQLSQVFTNLIGNAIDALTEHAEKSQDPTWQPTLTVTTAMVALSASPPDHIAITVQDNGMGIPADLQTKIFETFFTTKPAGKGTGFGLAIARQIVEEKHGGQLRLESQPGCGTQFTVLLPSDRSPLTTIPSEVLTRSVNS